MPKTTSIKAEKVPPEIADLADQIGGFIEYWGFKRIHGRIWTHLFLSAVPLDATTLTKRLKVSKALLSFSIRDLLEFDVIQEVAKGPRRTILYRANPNVADVITNVLRGRERRMLARIGASHRLLANIGPSDREAFHVSPVQQAILGELIRSAENALENLIKARGPERDFFESFKTMR